jgi:cardiolipin synthase
MQNLQWLGVLSVGLISAVSALHALLHKRDPTAAFAWVAVCVLFPLVGPGLYFLLGVNRIRTRARALRADQGAVSAETPLEVSVKAIRREFAQQARISRAVTDLPLTQGNRIDLLRNGDDAYPAMLEAIGSARERIYLSTYIFESNRTGQRFADALAAARRRGVDVRVLLDGAGEWYSLPRIRHRLRAEGIRVARFLPPRLLPPSLVLNLRNHRKILVVDGHTAFTGGMNIGDRHLVRRDDGREGVRDLHFRLRGEVVPQIEAVFLDDWRFTTGDDAIPPSATPIAAGNALCRTIVDGPNEDLNRLTMVLAGAIGAARRRVAIVTPYFLPPRELIGALQAAAVRGIEVDVVLPGRNNLPFMHWATRNMLWELLKWGVRVHYQRGAFAHTKLFLVDDQYAHIGSANLDARSLRLNFELSVEIYDEEFGRTVAEEVRRLIADSAPVTLRELDSRSLPARVRDAICWLFTPYL